MQKIHVPTGSARVRARQICPYCNKIKTMLDLLRVPYETTEVNPLTKREIKEWSGGYKKVPIAVLAGEFTGACARWVHRSNFVEGEAKWKDLEKKRGS